MEWPMLVKEIIGEKMKPSKNAVDAAIEIFFKGKDGLIGFRDGLTTAYAIDVEPLEQRIKELEIENKHLQKLVDGKWIEIT
jgi:hypothetical protein